MKRKDSPQVKIACSYSKLADPHKLKPNPGNPKSHPPEQIKAYCEILVGLGFRKSIVVSNQSGQIVTGHGAWMAALELGMSKVPVDYQDFADDDTERAFMLADNKLAEGGEIDLEKVNSLMAEFKPSFNLALTAFAREDLQQAEARLKKILVQAAPETSWVLIGYPTARFGEIAKHVEAIAAKPQSIVESTVVG